MEWAFVWVERMAGEGGEVTWMVVVVELVGWAFVWRKRMRGMAAFMGLSDWRRERMGWDGVGVGLDGVDGWDGSVGCPSGWRRERERTTGGGDVVVVVVVCVVDGLEGCRSFKNGIHTRIPTLTPDPP